jgi:hypothetical protein
MRYLALIYGDERAWDAMSKEEQQAVYEQHSVFNERAGDKIVRSAETAASDAATTVRRRNGQIEVTDGPFAESKEQLGGFYVFECDSEGEALELAKQVPGFDRGVVVVLQPAYVEAAA